jgi:2-dehydropantoate 2-reductase
MWGLRMNFTIVGAGAIGGVVGAYLAKAGEDVTLVDVNQEHILTIRNNGLLIETLDQLLTVNVPAKTVTEILGDNKKLDAVILAVKAQHTSEAIENIQPLLTESSIVVSMQNGLTENIVSERIGEERTIGCFVNFFSDYMKPGYIQYGGVGSLYIGELDGKITSRLLELQRKLKAWGDVKVTENIWGYLWSKLAYGAILTATALVDEKMADILEKQEYRDLFIKLSAEVLQVADHQNIEVYGFDDWEPNIVFRRNQSPNKERIDEQFEKLITRLRSYKKVKSGIWRDIAIKKRKTEVPDQLGVVIEKGKEFSFEMTLTEKLVDMITELEEGKRQMSWANLDELQATLGN